MKKLMHTKFISYTAVLAFVLNTFLPVWVAYVSPDHELKNVNELSQTTFFEDKILICTTQGFKWVSLADLEVNHTRSTPMGHSFTWRGTIFKMARAFLLLENSGSYARRVKLVYSASIGIKHSWLKPFFRF
jgi:hypothetical protein